MDKILLFIPAYNCKNQIVRVLEQLGNNILQYITEVIVVDNRSTDNTEQVVLDYINTHNHLPIKLLRNNENYGLGGSHKVAFQYAISNHYDYVIVLHGDDQANISDLLPLFKSGEYKKYDSMLGSRFIKNSKLEGYSKIRIIGNILFNILYSILLLRKINDLGSGLNIYKVNLLCNNYYLKYSDDLTFNCYMLLAVANYNQNICFFPISWREEDQTSNAKIFRQGIKILLLVIKYFFLRNKFLSAEHRENIVKNYSAIEIKESR